MYAGDEKRLWGGFRPVTRRKIMLVTKVRDTEGGEVDWTAYVGEAIPPVTTTVPMEYVETPEKVAGIDKSTEGLLGVQGKTTFLTDESQAFTGEVLIRVEQLSEEGARRLQRGSWSVSQPKPGEEPDLRGFFMHKGQTVGTETNPKYQLKQDNSMEIRWNPKQKLEGGAAFPTKQAIYAAIETAEKDMNMNGVGLEDSTFIDIVTGAEPLNNELSEGVVTAKRFARGWRRGQVRVLHAHIPAWVQYHEKEKPTTSHGDGPAGRKARARPEMSALRLRFPRGLYKQNANMIRTVEEKLGIEITMDGHPYPQYAIKDTLASIERGQPMKDGSLCNTRALLKMSCIMTKDCEGVTNPAEASAWMFMKAKVHLVGAGFAEELVTKGGAPTATAYSFGLLVENKDAHTMMRATNDMVSGSSAVKIRKWTTLDTVRLRVLPSEIYIADGAISVVPQQLQTTTRATSACDLITKLQEETKVTATQAGVDQSGYARNLQTHTMELTRMQGRIDAAALEQKRVELASQLEQIEKANAQLKKERQENRRASVQEEEAAKGEREPPKSPAKTKRKELTVEVTPQRGEKAQHLIELADVPLISNATSGQKASIVDLVNYLAQLEVFGQDFGIEPSTIEGYAKGNDATAKVYVACTYAGPTDSLLDNWTTLVGKDKGAILKKIDMLTEGVITMAPRVAAKPPTYHPDWLTAMIIEGTSPSPRKRALNNNTVTLQSKLGNDLRDREPNDRQATDSPSLRTTTTYTWGTPWTALQSWPRRRRREGEQKPTRCWRDSSRSTQRPTRGKRTPCARGSWLCAKQCNSQKRRRGGWLGRCKGWGSRTWKRQWKSSGTICSPKGCGNRRAEQGTNELNRKVLIKVLKYATNMPDKIVNTGNQAWEKPKWSKTWQRGVGKGRRGEATNKRTNEHRGMAGCPSQTGDPRKRTRICGTRADGATGNKRKGSGVYEKKEGTQVGFNQGKDDSQPEAKLDEPGNRPRCRWGDYGESRERFNGVCGGGVGGEGGRDHTGSRRSWHSLNRQAAISSIRSRVRRASMVEYTSELPDVKLRGALGTGPTEVSAGPGQGAPEQRRAPAVVDQGIQRRVGIQEQPEQTWGGTEPDSTQGGELLQRDRQQPCVISEEATAHSTGGLWIQIQRREAPRPGQPICVHPMAPDPNRQVDQAPAWTAAEGRELAQGRNRHHSDTGRAEGHSAKALSESQRAWGVKIEGRLSALRHKLTEHKTILTKIIIETSGVKMPHWGAGKNPLSDQAGFPPNSGCAFMNAPRSGNGPPKMADQLRTGDLGGHVKSVMAGELKVRYVATQDMSGRMLSEVKNLLGTPVGQNTLACICIECGSMTGPKILTHLAQQCPLTRVPEEDRISFRASATAGALALGHPVAARHLACIHADISSQVQTLVEYVTGLPPAEMTYCHGCSAQVHRTRTLSCGDESHATCETCFSGRTKHFWVCRAMKCLYCDYKIQIKEAPRTLFEILASIGVDMAVAEVNLTRDLELEKSSYEEVVLKQLREVMVPRCPHCRWRAVLSDGCAVIRCRCTGYYCAACLWSPVKDEQVERDESYNKTEKNLVHDHVVAEHPTGARGRVETPSYYLADKFMEETQRGCLLEKVRSQMEDTWSKKMIVKILAALETTKDITELEAQNLTVSLGCVNRTEEEPPLPKPQAPAPAQPSNTWPFLPCSVSAPAGEPKGKPAGRTKPHPEDRKREERQKEREREEERERQHEERERKRPKGIKQEVFNPRRNDMKRKAPEARREKQGEPCPRLGGALTGVPQRGTRPRTRKARTPTGAGSGESRTITPGPALYARSTTSRRSLPAMRAEKKESAEARGRRGETSTNSETEQGIAEVLRVVVIKELIYAYNVNKPEPNRVGKVWPALIEQE